MATSSIEWTDRVWNPTVGCSKVSAGCKHCYAETMHARLTGMGQAKYAETFTVVKPWAPQLADPLTWRKPARIFVNSMSDLFHEDVPDEYIAAVFGVMAAAPQHTFQVLTKRAERMARWFEWAEKRGHDGASMFPADDLAWRIRQMAHVAARRAGVDMNADTRQNHGGPWPLPNVWLGVSVENQEQADRRIPHLLSTPAAVRFLSCEPLLEQVRLDDGTASYLTCTATHDHPDAEDCCGSFADHGEHFHGVDWVIVGGESGHDARGFDLAWARSVVNQCREADVPVFVKQMGARPTDGDDVHWQSGTHSKGGNPAEWPEDLRVREFPVGGL